MRPPSVVARFALTLNATPPLSLAYLAGSLADAGHEVIVVDAVGEALDRFAAAYREDLSINGLTPPELAARVPADVDLVGISCLFSHEWPVVREIVGELQRRLPGVPIVLGGEHATAAPELSLEDAPGLVACALGEGEETIVDLADAVASGSDLCCVPGLVCRSGAEYLRTPPRARIRDLDSIPLPRWDLTPLDRYLDRGFSFGVDRGRTVPILATRGCPYRCTFCSSPQMWTTRYSARDPVAVVDEIAGYVERYRARNIDFYDLTAIVKKDWIVRFCEALIARRLPITWQLPSGTRSEAIDAEVAALLYRSGCRNVSYAPESGSVRILERIQKKIKPGRMLASMRASVAAGLNVKANILVGFPGEEIEDAYATMRFVAAMANAGVHDVSVWTFAPYPGSSLFSELRASGRIPALDDEYYASLLSYSNLFQGVSYSESLSGAQLERVRIALLMLFYAVSFARHPDRPLRSAYNVATRRFESRMEMSLSNLARRLARDSMRRIVARAAGRHADTPVAHIL